MVQLNSDSKVIIVNTAFLGDVLLTAFLTQKIKNQFASNISLVTNKQGAEIISPVDSVDNLFVLDKKNQHRSLKSTIEFAKTINEYKFDLLISLHRSFRTSIFVKQFKDTYKIGFHNSSFSSVYDKKIRYKNYLHEAERYLSTLFEDYSRDSISYTIDIDDKIYIENLLLKNGFNESKKTIIIAPGSVWRTKKWGNEKYKELSDILKSEYNVVAIGSPKDAVELPVGTINLIGKTSLPQLYHLVSISDLLITNDSAPTHLGSIVNVPTITIFGATSPIFGFAPISDNHLIIQNSNMSCRPCRIHGSELCPLGTHECMTSITAQQVAEHAFSLLKY